MKFLIMQVPSAYRFWSVFIPSRVDISWMAAD